MSDNTKASILLPCFSLALTVAAFAAGAPAKLARLNLRPAALLANLEFDASIRYEPAASSGQADVRMVASRRMLDEVLSRQLIALR